MVGQKTGGSSLVDFLETGLVRHVHLSDNDGQTDQHLPLGQGKIDWNDIKQKLQGTNVPEITIEC
ncbi:sugar phosphate isomerase/epimerase [Candidatus Micrarchaeota archaeon]|nr:sugar phosphate isomerase/epimerase [Candidatus Micrarchaeota archaeon]